ncbi:MAG: glycoside hydrolase family 36 protein [Phycisphaerae bacterium]
MSFKDFVFGDATARYLFDVAGDSVGLQLVPANMAALIVPRRERLNGLPEIDAIPDIGVVPADTAGSLVHVKLVGDPYIEGFAQGRTMLDSPSNRRFRMLRQSVEQQAQDMTVVTELKDQTGLRIEHHLRRRSPQHVFEVQSRFFNESDQPVTLELLTSFALGGITPFDATDAAERLRVHRFRSAWSAEGRLETASIEKLHLERSWSGAGGFSERFGSIGSMPVRGWFPFAAVEDTVAGVTWGAMLYWAGSWQMEMFRRHDSVVIAGGLADREFGHWLKRLAPGESLQTPTAVLACVQGDLNVLCDHLVMHQSVAAEPQPEVERDLPIIFNEWCTTWGLPTHERMKSLAQRLKNTPTRYFVIDAGWFRSPGIDWCTGHGDWNPGKELFLEGLEATAAEIRRHGLIPGLWFELETVGDSSSAFSLREHLLARDGVPLTVRHRRFWNFTDPFTIDYLSRKVIDLLRRCGFGYLKVDYNETIGVGCDGAESLGEGLRQQILGIYAFFDRIRRELPDLVIENCSSGGHRLEPSMLSRTAMSSFSDAHELVEIPIIAANLQMLAPPHQLQIWAVLHKKDSHRRLIYSLAATFLGRMAISGEIDILTPDQMQLLRMSQEFYQRCAPVIRHGVSRRFGQRNESWRHPRGWQAVRRVSLDNHHVLCVVHTFADAAAEVTIPLPDHHSCHISETLMAPDSQAVLQDGQLVVRLGSDFSAAVVMLRAD